MIVRTEAVVLRSLDYGETSEIVTLFTRERGKLAVMAKGSRRSGSRFGSSLQPMSYTQVVFYFKASRGIQTLSESSHVRSFHGITRDLEGLAYGLRIVELVSALMQEQEQNATVFELVIEVLERLSRTPAYMENLFHSFQLRFASILGFAPDIDRDHVDQISENGGLLFLDTGAIHPAESYTMSNGAARSTLRRASRSALRAFAVFARADLETAMRMRVPGDVMAELSHLIEDFLRYHVEESYPTRSTRVVGQMLDRG